MMKGELARFQIFSRRALLLGAAEGALALLLAGRLGQLAIIDGERYRLRSERNRIALRPLPPPRGLILDRAGRTLAGNRLNYQARIIPEETDGLEEMLLRLVELLELDAADLAAVRRRLRRRNPRERGVIVKENLSWEQFARLNVALPGLKGVEATAGLAREYPMEGAGVHVIGYVAAPAKDELDGDPVLQLPDMRVGKSGIEKTFEPVLRGRAGVVKIEIDAHGRLVRELEREAGTPGAPVQLTIDRALQEWVTDRLGEESAAVVVLDLADGGVLAYVSNPGFDPNLFVRGISQENWNALLKDPRRPLLDKCGGGAYPPGSTVKPIVALAALHHGIVRPDEKVVCRGKYRFGDNVWHCWRHEGHGPVDVVDAIARSCDVFFYEMAQRLGIERIAAALRDFGLGRAHPLGIGDQKAGLVPDPDWAYGATGRHWQGGETLNVGIGQGALLATPLQMAVAAARLATRQLDFTPRLVHGVGGVPVPMDAEDVPSGELAAAREEHWELVEKGLRAAVAPGGTAPHAQIPRRLGRLAGKTGTAQVRRISDEDRESDRSESDRPWHERHHAWFIAHAPARGARYAVAVLIEHGGGGAAAAAPVARDILRHILENPPARPDGAGTSRPVAAGPARMRRRGEPA